MMKPYLAMIIGSIQLSIIIWLVAYICQLKPQIKEVKTVLTNTDTIYQEIEVLRYRQDTIKLYYETKIINYRALPTTDRIQLFTKRINK